MKELTEAAAITNNRPMWQRIFSDSQAHLQDVKESYQLHGLTALRFAGTMLVAALAVAVHALVPAWFKYTGSCTIEKLHQELKARREKCTKNKDKTI